MITDAELAEIEGRDAEDYGAYWFSEKRAEQAIVDRSTLLREVKAMREPCVWTLTDYGYEASCSRGLTTGKVSSRFCPYCGHPIKEAT